MGGLTSRAFILLLYTVDMTSHRFRSCLMDFLAMVSPKFVIFCLYCVVVYSIPFRCYKKIVYLIFATFIGFIFPGDVDIPFVNLFLIFVAYALIV